MTNIRRRYFALAGAGAVVAGGLALAAPAASANPVGVGIVQNTQGEAGYFAKDNGQTRFRYVQAQVGVTNQIKNLDGSNTNLGGVGTELCDPNTGYSVQLGVQWTGSRFQVNYGHGFLGNTTSDPCIQSGLITNPTPLAPLALNPVAGDQLSFATYYNPQSHWITVNACDITQDNTCRQAHFNDGFKNLYEFGIGAVSNGPSLTAPANNPLVSFTRVAANYYSSTHGFNSIFVPAHWTLRQADWINGSSQVVMSSNGSLNGAGTAFNLFNGSTSA